MMPIDPLIPKPAIYEPAPSNGPSEQLLLPAGSGMAMAVAVLKQTYTPGALLDACNALKMGLGVEPSLRAAVIRAFPLLERGLAEHEEEMRRLFASVRRPI